MNKTYNLIYFGSPDFSAQILKSLLEDQSSAIKVVAVVTPPDAPTGRRGILTPSPVANLAQEYHLPLFKPEKLDDDNLKHLKIFNADLFLVVSYGQIVPISYLKTPSLSTLNLHFSLLPKYRGALCISEAIKNQDKQTGVTLMEMDKDLDRGPIITQEKVNIDQDDDVATLTQKLTAVGISLLQNSLPKYLNKELSAIPQDHTLATITPTTKTRNRQNSFIPWSDIQTAKPNKIHALIRSLNPDPGAWTKIPTTKGDIEAKLLKTRTTGNKLEIDLLQLPSKQPITFKQFLAGYLLKI